VPASMPMPMVVTPVITGAAADLSPAPEDTDAPEETETLPAPVVEPLPEPILETPEPPAAEAAAPDMAKVVHEEALDLEAVWAFREERAELPTLDLSTTEPEQEPETEPEPELVLVDEDDGSNELLLDAPVEEQQEPDRAEEPDDAPQLLKAPEEVELLLTEPEPPAPVDTPTEQLPSELPAALIEPEEEAQEPAPIRKSRFRPWRLSETPDPEKDDAAAVDDVVVDAPVAFDEADEQTKETAPETRQKVVVAAHPSIFGHFRDALAAFEQANPDVAISLDLNALTASRAEPMLAKGEADIVYYYAMSDLDRLESRYVWSESVSLFIGADHPLAQREEVSGDDLMAVRAILLGPRNGLRPILDNALRRGGVDLWHPVLESDDINEIVEAVRDNKGFFGAFGPLARDFGKTAGVRRIPFIDPLPPIEVRQAVRPEMADDAIVATLAEYLFR